MKHSVLARYLTARQRYDVALNHLGGLIDRVRHDPAPAALRQAGEVALRILQAAGYDLVMHRGEANVDATPDWAAGLDASERGKARAFGDNLARVQTMLVRYADEIEWAAKKGKPIETAGGDIFMPDIDESFEGALKLTPFANRYHREPGERIKRGPFNVVVIDGGDPKKVDALLSVIDAATRRVRGKFPDVLYGTITIKDEILYGDASALYDDASDTISMSLEDAVTGDDVETLVHELGHRWHDRFLDNDAISEAQDLHADRKYVTDYGRVGWNENVAEAFKLFVYGKALPPEWAAFMQANA